MPRGRYEAHNCQTEVTTTNKHRFSNTTYCPLQVIGEVLFYFFPPYRNKQVLFYSPYTKINITIPLPAMTEHSCFTKIKYFKYDQLDTISHITSLCN